MSIAHLLYSKQQLVQEITKHYNLEILIHIVIQIPIENCSFCEVEGHIMFDLEHLI